MADEVVSRRIATAARVAEYGCRKRNGHFRGARVERCNREGHRLLAGLPWCGRGTLPRMTAWGSSADVPRVLADGEGRRSGPWRLRDDFQDRWKVLGCQQISGVAGQRGTLLARGTCVGEWGVMPPCVADGTVLCRIATPAAEAQDAPAWLWRGCVAARHLNGCGVRVPDAGHSLGTCLQLLSLTPEPSRPSLPTPCSPARDQAG